MAKEISKKRDAGIVIVTVLVCSVLAAAVVFYIVSVNNSYTRGMNDGYSRAAKTIQSK